MSLLGGNPKPFFFLVLVLDFLVPIIFFGIKLTCSIYVLILVGDIQEATDAVTK